MCHINRCLKKSRQTILDTLERDILSIKFSTQHIWHDVHNDQSSSSMY
jgi:hypothetical protein